MSMTLGTDLDAALAAAASSPIAPPPFDPATLQQEITDLRTAVAALQAPIPPVVVPPDHPPIIQPIPTLSFTFGRAQSISLMAFCSDPDGDPLTLTLSGTLPAGIGFDSKSLNYDGIGAVASALVNQLFASDGKP